MLPFLDQKVFNTRTQASLEWLLRSFDVHGHTGSAAYYSSVLHPFKKWQLPYPETTGYIIETLLNYAAFRDNDPVLVKYALQGANWLLSLQMDSGAFPGGYRDNKHASVFNTGQIMIGLTRAYEFTKDQRYLHSSRKAASWLMEILEKDGSWRQAAYVPGYTPSYYTRVAWPVLMANVHLAEPAITEAMQRALVFYGHKVTPQDSVRDWSAFPGRKAFTHFIAYTIRGFLESGLLLKETQWTEIAIRILDKIAALYQKKGKLAGSYDEDWNGDYRFACITGHCQIALNLCRAFAVTGKRLYFDTAAAIFGDILPAQCLSPHSTRYGALPGSIPLWGKYLPFRYPNHAVKFFLDAALQLRTLQPQPC